MIAYSCFMLVLIASQNVCVACRVQLGDGTTNYGITPTENVLTGVATVVTGEFHTCALLMTGGVRCWGNNDHGQVKVHHSSRWLRVSVSVLACLRCLST